MRRMTTFGPRQQTLPRAELLINADDRRRDGLRVPGPAKNRLEIARRFRYLAG